MRSEADMLKLIIDTARNDDRIRAVLMQGSRVNPNAPKDIFQDYDIVYVVHETKPFYENPEWIHVFGKVLYMQRPDEVDCQNGRSVDFTKRYGWLMQLADGNRLDLHVVPVAEVDTASDSLTSVLLDKDSTFPDIAEPSDKTYWVKPPMQATFTACCNEFWWSMNSVAKGLWREEIPYAHEVLYGVSHPELVKILSWQAGHPYNFEISIGKSGKYLHRYLPKETWERFLQTYAAGTVPALWEATFIMCNLFHNTARGLAQQLNLIYDELESEAAMQFVRGVHGTPLSAIATR